MHPQSALKRLHCTERSLIEALPGLICAPMMWEGSLLLGVLASEPKPYRLSPWRI